jgi:hypothetical protein
MALQRKRRCRGEASKAVFFVCRGGEWVWETYGNALDQPYPTVEA